MKLHKARALRKGMTDAERLLWRYLRNRQVGGCKFRRQHPVGSFIVDFVCIEKRLIIELDGSQHAFSIASDVERTNYLKEEGYRVMRFWNNEVLQETDAVLSAIRDKIKPSSPLPTIRQDSRIGRTLRAPIGRGTRMSRVTPPKGGEGD